MGQQTTPIDASLAWAISKVRRAEGARAGGFPGAERILAQMTQGVIDKRVGLLTKERVPVREGTPLLDAQEQVIGKVTSGGFGPSLGGPFAMGYAPNAFAALGTEVFAQVRGKLVPTVVSRMPFVAQRYHRR